MKRTMFILAPIILGLLCMMVVGIQTARADVNCDLNSDSMVDIKDLALAAMAFGSRLDGPRWDPVADLDSNGRVDMRDIGIVALHFGQIDGLTFVIPELPIGPIIGLVGCFAALGIFRFKRLGRQN